MAPVAARPATKRGCPSVVGRSHGNSIASGGYCHGNTNPWPCVSGCRRCRVCVCVCECARSQARRSLAFVTDQIARTKIYNAIRTSFSPMNLARLRCMQYCVVACDRVVVCITLSVYLVVIVRIIAYFLVNNHLYEYAAYSSCYNRHIVSL